MNTPSGEKSFPRTLHRVLTRALIVAGILFLATTGHAQIGPGSGGTNNYTPLDSWTFNDHVNWTSDNGYYPVSFTNLNFAQLGNGQSLEVGTNSPTWLQYNVYENDGTTNLTVNQGTVMFWFAPNWSSTNLGGAGPGEWGRLFETGAYTTNSSYGWWSVYVDAGGNNLYFSAQTNDLSSSITTYFSCPILWTTNYFHFLTVTYSPTNTSFYMDGVLATNGAPLTVYPGLNALTNGFYVGSDNTGIVQANGLFNSVATYNVPMDAGTVQQIFNSEYTAYVISPWNQSMSIISSAKTSPSYYTPTFDVITGVGNLQWVGNASLHNYGANANQVWITNTVATAGTNGSMNVTFTIEGGQDGYYYDIFATAALRSPITNAVWAWLGQGQHFNIYTVNISSGSAFLILGTPRDTDLDGLTDAYELLVSHTDPNTDESDAYGVPYSWYAEFGLSPQSALQDPDQDGLLNYQEYLFGTRPVVSEGFGVWTMGGYSSIP